MTASNRTYDQQQHVESHAPYGTVFFILLNFTAMEYFYATYHKNGTGMLVITMLLSAIVVTIVTAVVASYFHLAFNRRWVQLTMIPAVLLAFVPVPLLLGLMILAVTKAALVGLYFMHLIFEGKWVYFMLVPAAFLATVFIVALYPDIGMNAGDPEKAAEAEQEVASAPFNPVPTAAPRR
jgi:hypothetical protein